MSTTGSVVIRRSLGRRLKALRLAAGKRSADVTTAGIASRAKLFKIEAGTVAVRMADVRTLCWLYGADQETTDALAEMSMNTVSKGWWESYSDVMPSWFATYVELESAASALRTYYCELVPGILQTAAYHQAVYDAQPNMTPAAAERQVAFRIARQRAAFERPTPLPVTAILSQGVLDREVGGVQVMAEQRAHLLASHAKVLVLPGSAGAHAAMKGPFSVLEFAGDDDPTIVYLETHAGGRYIEEPRVVETYLRIWESIRQQAVPMEESR